MRGEIDQNTEEKESPIIVYNVKNKSKKHIANKVQYTQYPFQYKIIPKKQKKPDPPQDC